MGLVERAKRWAMTRAVRKTAEEARVGKLGAFMKSLWQWLDGWKTSIVVVLFAIEEHCQSGVNACPGPFRYIGIVIDGLGWRQVAPDVDPGELIRWTALTVALGHRFYKAHRQRRMGVPYKQLLSGG